MKNRLASWAAGLCGALVFCAGTAAIAAESEPVAGNVCTADPSCAEQLSRAAEYSKAKQLPEALAAYLAAYERRSYGPILFNIARLYHRMGQLDKAAQFYQRFIDAAPTDAAEPIEKARGYLEQVKKERAANPPEKPGADAKPDVKTESKAAAVEPKSAGKIEVKPEGSTAAGGASLAPGMALDASLPPAPNRADKPPIYRRNWFWGITGGVIGGSVVGIIVGIVLRPRSLPDYATTIRFITTEGSAPR